jgi:glycosyltransferase involved in cell wall biosynthesis
MLRSVETIICEETPAPVRKRVLLIMGEVFANGGIQRFNRTLLGACGLLDVDCDLLALNDSEAGRESWPAHPSINVRVFDHDRIRFALATIAAARFGRYDIIIVGHINLLTLVVASLRPRLWSPVRILMIAHGIEVWSCIRGRRRRAIAAVDTVLCVSAYTAEMIRQQAPGLPDTRCAIFPNALSETWVEQFAGAGGNGERAGMPKRFLLSVTRLDKHDRYKGIVTALEAFAMLDDLSLHYVIAGRGDDQAFLERVVLRLQVSDRVRFLGGVSDVELAQLYRSCTAFVLPSGKEGFGIVFLEAMYFGAPVIAAAAKGALDVVQHEHTGLLVQYGDSVALKDAMERLLADKGLRDRIRIAGRQTVTEDGCFTFHAYVQRLAQMLDVRGPGATRPAASRTLERGYAARPG